MNKKVLITGIGGPAGRSALTYFKEKGFFVIGTDVRDVDVPADAFKRVPPALDGSFPDALLDIVAIEGPGLFVPTVTEELVIVAGLKEEIEELGCSVFISPQRAVEVANDKLKTALFMEVNGVPSPVTFDGKTPKDKVLKALGLPFIAKPAFGRGGRGVVLYRKEEDFYNDSREGLIYQEFIPGEEFDVNLFMAPGGRLSASVALKKTVMKEGVIGNAVEVERAQRQDVVEVSKTAARLLGMEGPLDFDVRLRSDGTPALLEINARVGGNVLYAVEVLDSLLNSWKNKNKGR